MLVLSDIHANLPALEAVIDDAPSDDILFCGDLIGYYPWPDQAVTVAKEQRFTGVRGNHDEALVTDSTFGFNSVAGEALRWTEEHISRDSREYLEELPYTWRGERGGQDIFIAHGSPKRPVEEYVYPETASEGFLERQGLDADVLLLGHTHVPFVKQVGGTLVVNPGSVGQPRDGDPRASYAVLDPDGPSAEVHRVEYDIEEVRDAVRDAGLPSMLGARLERGR